MRKMIDVSRLGAIGAGMLILMAATITLSSGNLFAATHTTLAESGSSTT